MMNINDCLGLEINIRAGEVMIYYWTLFSPHSTEDESDERVAEVIISDYSNQEVDRLWIRWVINFS